MCKKCKTNPVYVNKINKISYCARCFNKYFEKKVRKCIRVNKLIKKNEKIGVAVSGGKDSLVLLYLLVKILKQRNELIAITVDEGISKKNIIKIEKLCEKNNIELKKYSFKGEFNYKLPQILKKFPNVLPCSVCAVLRRSILNKKSRELKINKLATGHNLDDEAQSILMNQFKNNVAVSARLGPLTGVTTHKGFVRRIKPLYFMLEKEIEVFAKINKIAPKKVICKYRRGSFRNSVANFLNKFEKRYLGTKYAIINSFLEILPLLKKEYKKKKINLCEKCGEPCSGKICRVCYIISKLYKGRKFKLF